MVARLTHSGRKEGATASLTETRSQAILKIWEGGKMRICRVLESNTGNGREMFRCLSGDELPNQGGFLRLDPKSPQVVVKVMY